MNRILNKPGLYEKIDQSPKRITWGNTEERILSCYLNVDENGFADFIDIIDPRTEGSLDKQYKVFLGGAIYHDGNSPLYTLIKDQNLIDELESMIKHRKEQRENTRR